MTEADLFPESVRKAPPAKANDRQSLKPGSLERTMHGAFDQRYAEVSFAVGMPRPFLRSWSVEHGADSRLAIHTPEFSNSGNFETGCTISSLWFGQIL